MVRLPGSGPEESAGEAVPVITPKLLLVPVEHNAPLPPTGPGVVALLPHEAFGLAKWGVFGQTEGVGPYLGRCPNSHSLKSRMTLRLNEKYPGPIN